MALVRRSALREICYHKEHVVIGRFSLVVEHLLRKQEVVGSMEIDVGMAPAGMSGCPVRWALM